MLKTVTDNGWFASSILALSWLLGFCLIKTINMNSHLTQEWEVRAWFLLCFIPIFCIALWQNPQFCWSKINQKRFDWQRIGSKFIVVLLQLLTIITCCFIFLQLNLVSYNVFIDDVLAVLPFLLLVVFIYVMVTDSYLANPEDEYAKIGKILNRQMAVDRDVIKSFLLKTLVKVIFIPYMYSSLINLFYTVLNMSWALTPINLTKILFNVGVTLDVLIGTSGYLLSLKLINNDIKDTESHFLGWLFALLCYPPLFILRENINKQADDLLWSDIVPKDTIIYWLFFITVNLTWVIYWLATAEFGITFSNLSWRRLVNTGVYRYTKHPAYIAKNLYWWLNTLPFFGIIVFSLEWWHNILALTLTSLIYFGRAWSEERHLSKFPEYRAYMQYINEHGIFRWIKLPPISPNIK